MKRLQIGIIGTARIARDFAAAIAPSETVQVAGIASRTQAGAEEFARALNVQRAFASYDELLKDSSIEAVYLPLPNSLHAQWTMRALEAGKHVLCEKPLAATVQEAKAMFAAAHRAGLMLVEGFPYRAQPYMHALKKLLESGAIGKAQWIQAGFSFTVMDQRNIRLNLELAGGALMDGGTYPVSLVRLATGQRPAHVQAMAQWHPNGVDQTLVAQLEHENGCMAQISCSLGSAVFRGAHIVGDEGAIETSYPNHPRPVDPSVLRLKRGASWDANYESIDVSALNGFLAEAESFERAIRLGASHWNGATPEESIDIMQTLEAILLSARTRSVVSVADLG